MSYEEHQIKCPRLDSSLPTFYGLPLLDDDGEMRLVPKRDLRDLQRPVRGAFTGGFSAGYYNSVSSERGFEPCTFFSTRSQKTKEFSSVVQRPEDFMDSEDFDIHGIAPKIIRVSADHRTGPFKASSKAIELLARYGWKIGQGIGPREPIKSRYDVYPSHLENSTLAPLDVLQQKKYQPKTNQAGIGYKGLLPPTQTVQVQSQALLPRGQAFGVGVLNNSSDDDDIAFGQMKMSEYDFELDDNSSKPPKLHSELPEFVFVKCLGRQLSASMEIILEKAKEPSLKDDSIHQHHKRPNVSNIKERREKISLPIDHIGGPTEWQSKVSSGLTSRFNTDGKIIAKLEKDDAMEASRMGMQGKLTRTEEEWIPEDGTFRVFNLAVNKQLKKRKSDVNVFDILDVPKEEPLIVNELNRPVLGVAVGVDEQTTSILAQLSEWRNEISNEDKRPPSDLFSMIFLSDEQSKVENQMYGPHSPPKAKLTNVESKSLWELPRLDNSHFEEKTNIVDDDKWEWAQKAFGH